MLVEYLSRLPEAGRNSLEHILYDDACHLKKFSEDPKRANLNSYTKYLANIPKHVDNFHFNFQGRSPHICLYPHICTVCHGQPGTNTNSN